MPETTEDDEVILPWRAVESPHTKTGYKRDARWFLEFAGFVDPRKMHHKPEPDLGCSTSDDRRQWAPRLGVIPPGFNMYYDESGLQTTVASVTTNLHRC